MSEEMDSEQEADPARELAFRDAMALFPTGVTLRHRPWSGRRGPGDHREQRHLGVARPLLLLVCVEHASRLHDVVLAAGRFAVSVLGLDGEPVSRKLARRGHDTEGALAGVPHHRGPHTGALLLDDALATFECVTTAAHPGGDHTVLIGEVLAVEMPAPGGGPRWSGTAPATPRSRPRPDGEADEATDLTG